VQSVGEDPAIEQFKNRTLDKLREVRCPVHRQLPRVRFEGSDIRDIRINMSGCCSRLIKLANKAIAGL
jgi:hypothetical protein